MASNAPPCVKAAALSCRGIRSSKWRSSEALRASAAYGFQDESFQSGAAEARSTTHRPSIFIWATHTRDECVLANIWVGGLTSGEIFQRFISIIIAMESNILDAAL